MGVTLKNKKGNKDYEQNFETNKRNRVGIRG